MRAIAVAAAVFTCFFTIGCQEETAENTLPTGWSTATPGGDFVHTGAKPKNFGATQAVQKPSQLSGAGALPWTSGRRLAVHGDTLVAVDTDNGNVVRIDRHSGDIQTTIAVGQRPEQVAVGPNGTAYVTRRYGSTLAIIPRDSNQVSAQVEVGAEPWGVALSADAKTVYVVSAGQANLLALDVDSLKVVANFETHRSPRSVAIDRKGRAYVGHKNHGVLRFTPAGGLVEDLSLRTSNPGYDPAPVGDLRVVPNNSFTLAPHPVSDRIFTGHTIAHTGELQECTTYYSMVTCTANTGPTRPIETSVTAFEDGHDTISARDAIIDEQQTGESMLNIITTPADVNHHPTWSMLFVVGLSSDNVLALNSDANDPLEWPIAEIKVGQAPRAIAFSADGSSAYVLNSQDFTVGEIPMQPLMDMEDVMTAGSYGKSSPIKVHQQRVLAYGADPMPEHLREGRRLFTYARDPRISFRGDFACAGCHFDGTDDGLTWFSSTGAHQTLALAGRVATSAPYGWDGDDSELTGYLTGTINRMGGNAAFNLNVLEPLADFITSGLVAPPARKSEGAPMSDAELRGQTLFNAPAIGCATCHVDGGADGKNHSVGGGSISKVNTPSLRGIDHSAPYLHDGTAETLTDAITTTAGWMGHTAQLTAAEIDDLVAYLKTL